MDINEITEQLCIEEGKLESIRDLMDKTESPSSHYSFLIDEEIHVLGNIACLTQMKEKLLMSEQP